MSTLIELLRQRAEIEEELLRFPFMRNRNNPIADLSEQLTARVLGGEVVKNNSKGHDVVLPDGTRIEVKSRKIGGSILPGQLFGVLREPLTFQKVAFLIFDHDYNLRAMRLVDVDTVRDLSKHSNHVNGWQPFVKKVLNADVQDNTAEAKTAWDILAKATANDCRKESVSGFALANRIEHKPRLWFQRNWVGQGVEVEFTAPDGITYRYPHDEILEAIIAEAGTIVGTRSWEVEGVYHMKSPSQLHRELLEPFRTNNASPAGDVKGRVAEVP